MNEKIKEKVIEALHKNGVELPCPRCSSINFEVVGQTIVSLNDNARVLTLGGPAIPSAIIACSHCGFMTLHALSSLNISPE